MGNPTDGPDYLAVYDVTGEDICQMQGFSQAGSDLADHIAAFDPPTAIALLDELERLRALPRDRSALNRAVGAAQDAGDEAGIELTRSDLEPIVCAAIVAALGGEQ